MATIFLQYRNTSVEISEETLLKRCFLSDSLFDYPLVIQVHTIRTGGSEECKKDSKSGHLRRNLGENACLKFLFYSF